VAAEPPVVLPAAKVLYVELGGRVIHDFSQDARSLEQWLTDPRISGALIEEHSSELELSADFGLSIVEPHDVAFAHPVLSRPVFKYCVHGSFLAVVRTRQSVRLAKEAKAGQRS
jgi:hypothetical protein